MPPTVRVRDLWKRYGAVEAVRGVSFDVEEGETFGLIGPNGAGKTTTIECLIGLREPDAGRIEVCGIDALDQPRAVRQKIGAALQTTSLQDKVTPREALALFGSFYDHPRDPQALLDRFSLADKADTAFDALSGGQKQRLALALAFVNGPDLLFLDEPTAGLDPHARRDLHDEIGLIKRDGHTVLLTTHYMDEAERLCDRVAIIDRGRIVATGTPAELVARSGAPVGVSLTTGTPLSRHELAGLPGLEDLVIDGTTVRFRSATVPDTLQALMELLRAGRIDVTALHVRKATLEDVFLELTAEPAGA